MWSTIVDRDNKFSKIKQGVIHVRYHPEATAGLRPKLRVEGSIGYIDIHSTNMAFSKDVFDMTSEILYDLWRREIKATIKILEPKITRFKFIVHSEERLMEMLGTENFKLTTDP